MKKRKVKAKKRRSTEKAHYFTRDVDASPQKVREGAHKAVERYIDDLILLGRE